MRAISIAAICAIFAITAAYSHSRVELRFADCRTAPAVLRESLGRIRPNWAAYVQLCPVRAPSGRIVLSILTVRVDLVSSEGEDDPFPTRFPHALILDVNNAIIGELAAAVPGGPPGTTVVTFSDWRNEFPHRIDVRQINAAVRGTFNERPLVWNPGSGRYE